MDENGTSPRLAAGTYPLLLAFFDPHDADQINGFGHDVSIILVTPSLGDVRQVTGARRTV